MSLILTGSISLDSTFKVLLGSCETYDCCPYPLFRDLDVIEHSAQPGQGHTHSQLAPPPHPTRAAFSPHTHPTQQPSHRTRIPPGRLLTAHASHRPRFSSPHPHPTSSCSISTGSSNTCAKCVHKCMLKPNS
jgi:hypothetical protein